MQMRENAVRDRAEMYSLKIESRKASRDTEGWK
jgi:hypothetical protein